METHERCPTCKREMTSDKRCVPCETDAFYEALAEDEEDRRLAEITKDRD